MQNFKSTVPAELQAKVKAFADAFHGEWSHIISTGESYGTLSAVNEIEGNYRSGWMPRQDGGFEISELYLNEQDSSYHFTEKQTEWANDQAKDCFLAFLSDNGIDSETDYDDLTEEQREELFEYEMEWFEPALVRLQIFVDGYSNSVFAGDEKQVTIRLSINYSDAPYYREGDDEDLKLEILSIDEFMQADIPELLSKFTI